MPETATPTTVGTGPASADALASQPDGDPVNIAVGSTSNVAMKKKEDNPSTLLRRVARLRQVNQINERKSLHG